jgi:tyrosine-protein phosphatase SIW14
MRTTDILGIRNCRIVDAKVFRGGDVTEEGIVRLSALGVVRVICLKNFDSSTRAEIADEKLWVEAAGMIFTHVPLEESGMFGYDDGAKVPAILQMIAKTDGRVFVNCHKGSDRTGVVVACYRITKGWTADQALKEMRGYGAAWKHFGMRGFVKKFEQLHQLQINKSISPDRPLDQ